MQPGLMDFIRQMGVMGNMSPGFGGGMMDTSAQQPGAPQLDQFGVQLPPAPGAQPPAPPPIAPPQGQHIGDVMGQQPMMDPSIMEMIMRLFGQGQTGGQ